MNYYDAREKIVDGESVGWHYTSFNRRTGTRAVGTCVDHEPHATKDEAYRCYTEYLLDSQLRLQATERGVKRQCAAADCGEWTEKRASLDISVWVLCDLHRNRETVASLFGTVGQITASW